MIPYIYSLLLISIIVCSPLSVYAADAVVSGEGQTETQMNAAVSSTEAPATQPVVAAPDIQAGKTVTAIDIVGNNTISMATILSKIKTRVGQEYIQTVISDDLKRLYNTGYFSDVRVDYQPTPDGVKVVIYLEEKSIVEEVTFSKTRYIKAKTLKRKIKTQVGKFLDKKDLRDDIQTIKDLYAQKGLTSVEVDVETFVDAPTNKTTLHFVVREGQRIRIKKINVYGNDAFGDKKILRVIKTRRKALFNSGYLKEDVLIEDIDRIVAFYEQQGYIDVKAAYKTDYLYQGYVVIDITLTEGRRYSVGSIALAGNAVISEKEVRNAMKEITQGGVFSREKLTVDLANIRTLYFDRGYIFANVEDATAIDPETGNVGVTLTITEGNLAYIEQVKIQGNTRTRDIVIRRELRMRPGDRFDGSQLRRSRERLTDLGYFEDVSFDIEDTEAADRKNLLVQVKEAKTGTFSFGGGFSTVDQIVGFVEIEQKNFDFTNWPTFTGGGQQLQLRAETGSTKNNVTLSFTEPWLFDYPVSGGFDIYRQEREREEDTGYAYDQTRIGGGLRLGKEFTEYISGTARYTLEKNTIGNFEDGVSADLLAEEGENTISSLGFTVTRDTRDSKINPARGYVVTGGYDIAGGPVGGDKDFNRLQAMGSYYVPLTFKSVLEFRTHMGVVDPFGDTAKVPIFERFFAGGARTIRGYDERAVGPLDANTEDPVGGEAIFVSNVEYTIPIVDFVKLATFFDIGNVWADMNDFGTGDLKAGMGLGLRVKTPIGPINLDYGYPLSKQEGEEDRSGKFYFSVSRGF